MEKGKTPEKTIVSRYNSSFKELKSMLEPRGAKKAGRVLISGRKIVPEFVANAEYGVAEDGEWPDDLPKPKHVVFLDRPLFKDLDIFGTHFPLLVLNAPELQSFTEAAPSGLELVLSMQDPSNLGAALRSAEAFGVDRVILSKECAFPFHPKAIRSSSGSCFRLQLLAGPSINEMAGENCIGFDRSGASLDDFEWPANSRLLIGEEGQGLPEDFKGKKVAIPMQPSLDSLNATIAASIGLFSYRLTHKLKEKK